MVEYVPFTISLFQQQKGIKSKNHLINKWKTAGINLNPSDWNRVN